VHELGFIAVTANNSYEIKKAVSKFLIFLLKKKIFYVHGVVYHMKLLFHFLFNIQRDWTNKIYS